MATFWHCINQKCFLSLQLAIWYCIVCRHSHWVASSLLDRPSEVNGSQLRIVLQLSLISIQPVTRSLLDQVQFCHIRVVALHFLFVLLWVLSSRFSDCFIKMKIMEVCWDGAWRSRLANESFMHISDFGNLLLKSTQWSLAFGKCRRVGNYRTWCLKTDLRPFHLDSVHRHDFLIWTALPAIVANTMSPYLEFCVHNG